METNRDLRLAFERDEQELRLRQSKIACVLGIVLIPAGLSLDAVIYPTQFADLAVIRLSAAALIGLLYALHFRRELHQHVHFLTMAGLLIAVSSMSAMIAITEGAGSSYYLGIFLILFLVGVLAPVRVAEATVFCIATIAIYVAGCFAASRHVFSYAEMFNNLYFLSLTCIISVTTAHFHYRQRFNAFTLKYKLSLQHQQLSALDRLKSQFFANVSHELRTPLTLILAPVEKIKAEAAAFSEGTRELLDIVENNALRLLRLVNDILNLIKLEEGGATLALKTFDLGHFLRQTAASMKHFAGLKNVALSIGEVEGQLFIMADTDAMEKIVTNIVTNAIKFTPDGGRIEINAGIDGSDVVVKISDTGIGIPADKLAHIFDRFYQVDGSATRRHQGLGLGLAMVRELVNRHGGSVDATSAAGDGTTFTLTFPHVAKGERSDPTSVASADLPAPADPLHALDKKAAAQALVPVLVTPSGPSNAAERTADRPRLLIVDDEPDMRRYLVAMLCEAYQVFEAVDGDDALAKAKECSPDLMLLDVMLPGTSGLEVCKVLKSGAGTRAIKIIMLTARVDEEAKIVALTHGADDFLVKPFSGLEVRTRIVNLLRAAALERELKQTNCELTHSLKQLRETEAALVQNARLSALGTMAAGLLHEIGNPLNFMGTALQLAARDKTIQLHPDTQETFQDIRAGYDRIHRVVTDLRGFTAPHRPDSPRVFDIEEAIDHSLRFTAHVQKGVTITKRLADTRAVTGSPSTISQVFVNLIVNAIAAVRTIEDVRQPEIEVRTEVRENQMLVFVKDNGTGIKSEIVEQIFDPFFSTKEVGEGMGLGLAVSHRIISNHGGSLKVSSNPGEWSEFSFNLPLADPAGLAASVELKAISHAAA